MTLAPIWRTGDHVAVRCPHCQHIRKSKPNYMVAIGPNIKCAVCIRSMKIDRNRLWEVLDEITGSKNEKVLDK